MPLGSGRLRVQMQAGQRAMPPSAGSGPPRTCSPMLMRLVSSEGPTPSCCRRCMRSSPCAASGCTGATARRIVSSTWAARAAPMTWISRVKPPTPRVGPPPPPILTHMHTHTHLRAQRDADDAQRHHHHRDPVQQHILRRRARSALQAVELGSRNLGAGHQLPPTFCPSPPTQRRPPARTSSKGGISLPPYCRPASDTITCNSNRTAEAAAARRQWKQGRHSDQPATTASSLHTCPASSPLRRPPSRPAGTYQ